ncbi:MAG: enoyl-CoA hydratase-related protein [Spongiibacteraceae bacterium]
MVDKSLVLVSDDGNVRTLTLSDSASLNSLGETLAGELFAQLRLAEAEPGVRVVVITGAGKMFCAGGNLKDFAAVTEPLDQYIRRVMGVLYNPLAEFIEVMETPLISAVNGPAIGAGVGLALSADLVIMAESAFFSLPFVPHLGVVPDMGTSWFLPRELGYKRALGLALTGEKLLAADAYGAGLVWECVGVDGFSRRVGEVAESIARLPLSAVLATKKAFSAAVTNTLTEQLSLERQLQAVCFGSEEFSEGLSAFAEKRPPDFVTIAAGASTMGVDA